MWGFNTEEIRGQLERSRGVEGDIYQTEIMLKAKYAGHPVALGYALFLARHTHQRLKPESEFVVQHPVIAKVLGKPFQRLNALLLNGQSTTVGHVLPHRRSKIELDDSCVDDSAGFPALYADRLAQSRREDVVNDEYCGDAPQLRYA